jgi:hypothetical protein
MQPDASVGCDLQEEGPLASSSCDQRATVLTRIADSVPRTLNHPRTIWGNPAPTVQQEAEEEAMVTTEEDTISQLQDEVKSLEVAQAVQGATLAGAQATQAAAHAGTWSTMLAGAAGLIVGIFLAIAIGGSRRR